MAKGQAKSEMPASPSKSAAQSKSKSAGKGGPNALDLLTEDHKKVQQLFKAFEKLEEDDEKAEIVKQACQDLTVHTEIEEDIFYPAARDALDEAGDDLLDEAEVEHATAKDLIEQLEEMEPGDELYDAKFTVLGEYVNHHIKEEQDELFPKLRKAKIDLEELGAEMAARKQELMAELQGDEDDDADDDAAEDGEGDDGRR